MWFIVQDKASYKDDFGDSDNENEPDAYLQRVKAEGQERSDDDDDDSGESTDEDFNPDKEKVEDVADEYDSNLGTTDSDSEGGSDDSSKARRKEKKEKKKVHKERKESSVSDSYFCPYSINLYLSTFIIN